MGEYPLPPAEILLALRKGMVIPAHPLALTKERRLDEKRQRALTRYYIAAGAGGIAIGVHTTQFEIHHKKVGLYRPVLELASETIRESEKLIVKIAGICGKTKEAISEAEFAMDKGYHAGLLSLTAFKNSTVDEMITHCKEVAKIIPIFGFYLQPSVGGRILDFNFWRKFLEIENVIGIKIAPFNRYQTLDVVRAVAESGRNDIALYTGNDDNIVNDLLTDFVFAGGRVRIVGGLLGHWAFWTKKAVELLEEIHSITERNAPIPAEMLRLAVQITDANAAIFDAANGFAGCIPGIHEVLRRQGLMKGRWCLDSSQELSAGQNEEIDRIYRDYPEMNDDSFVRENLDRWLRD